MSERAAASGKRSGKRLPTRITTEFRGLIQHTITNTYDAKGRLLKRETFDDIDGDGTLDEYDSRAIETYTYDAQGLLIEFAVEDTAIGRQTERYWYDAQNRLSRGTYELDQEPDGTIDQSSWWTYQYDAHGNVVRYTADGDYFGMPLRSTITYAYDDHSNVTRKAYRVRLFRRRCGG